MVITPFPGWAEANNKNATFKIGSAKLREKCQNFFKTPFQKLPSLYLKRRFWFVSQSWKLKKIAELLFSATFIHYVLLLAQLGYHFKIRESRDSNSQKTFFFHCFIYPTLPSFLRFTLKLKSTLDTWTIAHLNWQGEEKRRRPPKFAVSCKLSLA